MHGTPVLSACGASDVQAAMTTRSARSRVARTRSALRLVGAEGPGLRGAGVLAELGMPRHQPPDPLPVGDVDEPHLVEERADPRPGVVLQEQVVALADDDAGRRGGWRSPPRPAARGPVRSRGRRPSRGRPTGAGLIVARKPCPSKVSGAPLRSRRPRASSWTSARWNPSIGRWATAASPIRSASAATRSSASVVFPAPGAPATPMATRSPSARDPVEQVRSPAATSVSRSGGGSRRERGIPALS